ANKVYISDPQLGLMTYTIEEFQYGWKKNNDKGVVLVIETSPSFFEKNDVRSSNSFSNYIKYVRPHSKFMFQVLIGMIVGIAINLIFPFITQSIVDIGIEKQDFDFINILLIASVVLTLSSAVSGYIQSRMMLYVADKMNISMVSDFIKKLLQLPINFYERKMTSDILNRINDHNRIQEFILNSFLGIIVSGISFIVYGILLAYYDYKLFLFFI